jgi:hypothetical protein
MLSGSGMNIQNAAISGVGAAGRDTVFGARGLEGQNGRHFLTAQLNDFKETIRHLARDPAGE